MNWANKIKTAWQNKEDIIEGFKNNVFKKEHVEEIAAERLSICKGCEFYDPKGESKNVIVKGTESCGHCGCATQLKIRCLSCKCPIDLWDAIVDDETNMKIHEIIE